jgi:hypothetical protein
MKIPLLSALSVHPSRKNQETSTCDLSIKELIMEIVLVNLLSVLETIRTDTFILYLSNDN